MDALEGLSEENRHAWDVFRRICTRFALDLGVAGLAAMRLLAAMDDEDFSDMLMRLGLLYDVCYPPKRGPSHGA
jgi:hypothetical protein